MRPISPVLPYWLSSSDIPDSSSVLSQINQINPNQWKSKKKKTPRDSAIVQTHTRILPTIEEATVKAIFPVLFYFFTAQHDTA